MIFWTLLGMIPIAMIVGTVAWWEDKDLVYGSIAGPLILGGFVLLLVGAISAAECKQVYGVLYEAEIASVKTDERISGSFFLGCGMIGTKTYYYWYQGTSETGYRLRQEDVRKCKIWEVDGPPKVKIWGSVEAVPTWWVSPFAAKDNWVQYDLYVPKGTIIRQFKL